MNRDNRDWFTDLLQNPVRNVWEELMNEKLTDYQSMMANPANTAALSNAPWRGFDAPSETERLARQREQPAVGKEAQY